MKTECGCEYHATSASDSTGCQYPALREKNAQLEARVAALDDRVQARIDDITKMQKHRDEWRGYAYGLKDKPKDFIDGNLVDPRPMTILEIQAIKLQDQQATISRLTAEVESYQRTLRAEYDKREALDSEVARLTAEQRTLRNAAVTLTEELNRVKAFVVEKCGPKWANRHETGDGYYWCACGNNATYLPELQHAPDCMWKAMGGGNG